MNSPETWPDAKLYRADSEEKIFPFQPENRVEFQSQDSGSRLIVSTSQDRIDFFKSIIDLFPGPYFITLVIQEPFGAFQQAGRYYSERDKTRLQIDYFLDYFHDFISYDGFHHLWITCESTDGIIVYDQHDYFFIYVKAEEARQKLLAEGFVEGDVRVDFPHMHRSRAEIVPGPKEILKYGSWYLSNLEIQDVATPERKTLRNYWLRIRNWNAQRKAKSKNKRKGSK